eukprot:5578630-Pyramimonas_sp.AAC.1
MAKYGTVSYVFNHECALGLIELLPIYPGGLQHCEAPLCVHQGPATRRLGTNLQRLVVWMTASAKHYHDRART